jgi:hypothetical protein
VVWSYGLRHLQEGKAGKTPFLPDLRDDIAACMHTVHPMAHRQAAKMLDQDTCMELIASIASLCQPGTG